MVKLIIWAANTKAPPTAIMGSFWRVSWLRCTRAALTASAPALTAHMVSPTVGGQQRIGHMHGFDSPLFQKFQKQVQQQSAPGSKKKAMRGRRPSLPGWAVAFMADNKQAGRFVHRQPWNFD